MGFKDWVDKKRQEKRQRKQEEQEESQQIDDILNKFEIPDFEKFFDKVLGSTPNLEYDYDIDTGNKVLKNPLRREYLEFIWENIDNEEISYQHLKDFAIRWKVLPPSFFGIESDEVGDKGEFANIINVIHRDFQPEKITNEEHLQSQLTVFLKAKFSDMKVEREAQTKRGDKLDIVINDKYVFELKVPRNRTQLRNLSAQLEEYVEQYPNLCAVIADISNVEIEEGEPIESNLTQIIKEYADNYKRKYNVQTLIFDVETRN